MTTSKSIDRICVIVLIIALVVTAVFMNGKSLGIVASDTELGYESRLFDTSRVHTIDIVMDDWDSFIENATSEEYAMCAAVIDNEAYKNIAIRAKGNTSLSTVSQLGSDRYSFKIEFDHYDSGKTYHGLDKLCLNNIIQDATFMKDYLTYRMMDEFGVSAPLCSFAYITVNGEDWGLYLAVEGVEDSFLTRNYGAGSVNLYKPDSQSMGGGRGFGRDFDMEGAMEEMRGRREEIDAGNTEDFTPPDMGDFDSQGGPGGDRENFGGGAGGEGDFGGGPGGDGGQGGPGGGGGMGSDDVKLKYTDNDPDSYKSIFENAKTDITEADEERLIASLKALGEGENLGEILDIDEVLRYFVVHNYVVNGDSYTGSMVHNYYLYEADGQLSMIPWDYNLAFGTFQSDDSTSAVNDPIDSPLSVSLDGDRPMAEWFLIDEEYNELYHEYFQEFLDTVDIASIIDEAAALIDSYVEKDPTKFYTYEEFLTGVETLKAFCELRSESVRGQLDGTIPSTDDAQSEDSSALIDASSITLSDMGTMNMGGQGGGMEMGGQRPDGDRGEFGGRGESGESSGEMAGPGGRSAGTESDAAGAEPPAESESDTEVSSGSSLLS